MSGYLRGLFQCVKMNGSSTNISLFSKIQLSNLVETNMS